MAEGKLGFLRYSAWIGNGLSEQQDLASGQQFRDNNKNKAWGGRLGGALGDSLEVGGSCYTGKIAASDERRLTMKGSTRRGHKRRLKLAAEYFRSDIANPEPTGEGQSRGLVCSRPYNLRGVSAVVSYQSSTYEDGFHGPGFQASGPGLGISRDRRVWAIGLTAPLSPGFILKAEYDFNREPRLELKNDIVRTQIAALSFNEESMANRSCSVRSGETRARAKSSISSRPPSGSSPATREATTRDIRFRQRPEDRPPPDPVRDPPSGSPVRHRQRRRRRAPGLLPGDADLKPRGPREPGIVISRNAHLIMPYHPDRRDLRGGPGREEDRDNLPGDRTGLRRQGCPLGHPGRGPARPCRPREKIRENVRGQERFPGLRDRRPRRRGHLRSTPPTPKLAPYIRDASHFLHEQIRPGKGFSSRAPRALLDIDHGTYPFVTSSNSTAGGVCTGLGVGPKVDAVLGIMKAYTTRVGGGPFPTEILDERGRASPRGATSSGRRRGGRAAAAGSMPSPSAMRAGSTASSGSP